MANLLVSTGYLKVVPPKAGEMLPRNTAWVEIPNQELETVFEDDIVSKTRRYTVHYESDEIAKAIVFKDPAKPATRSTRNPTRPR